ncbi:fimbrial protein [Providencia manganoxydans]|uniref:fimbrial protein n=1 Tax=Providencia manganoxydans TaxID=2923283 RepID=UPI0034E5D3AE
MKHAQCNQGSLSAGWCRGICFAMVLLLSQKAFAAGGSVVNSITINVGVTVQATTCDIQAVDGGDTIAVDFKTITKKGIESGEYQSAVPFRIVCSDDSPSLTLQLLGDGATFDTTLLASTDNKGLGFEFQLNNQKIGLNTVSSNFTTETIPELTVLPRLDKNATNLVAGGFTSASAKLILDYQ